MDPLPRRLLAWLLDALLLVPALLLVLGEHVLWQGSRAVLRALAGAPLVKSLHLWLGLLPPSLALPLFLIPEVFSHASEFGTAFLLAKGHVAAATLLVVLGKGVATLILVWIYQACEPALLRVRWFARVHHAVLRARAALLARFAPIRRTVLIRLRRAAPGGAVGRRFRRWRKRLASGLEVAWPKR
ncbi:MAG: hypothetical protein JOY66_05990 [Acetobacteraceae bacterium]|nr:hypothetical protein [Acetobacteraceae bacterium]